MDEHLLAEHLPKNNELKTINYERVHHTITILFSSMYKHLRAEHLPENKELKIINYERCNIKKYHYNMIFPN